MFHNHLLTAWRNFRRNKFSTFIHIVGLAIGVSTALIIFLIVQYDFSFEQFRPDKDRIYRVITGIKQNTTAAVPHPLPDAVHRQVTGLDGLTFVRTNEGVTMSPDPGTNAGAAHLFFNQMKVAFVDTSYFSLFPAVWIAGSPAASLRDPSQVVLTESRARLYFPGVAPSNVIGKLLRMDDTVHLTVSGVIKDEDRPTNMYFQVFISYPTLTSTSLSGMISSDWDSYTTNDQFFLRLPRGGSPRRVEAQLGQVAATYNTQVDKRSNPQFQLEPLTRMHLDPDMHTFGPAPADSATLLSLELVAVFLLLMACINYVNLSTAQATVRAREIGVRKTMGSSRSQLIMQFLAETLLLTASAALLSALLAPLFIKAFSDFIPEGVRFQPFQNPVIFVFLVALVLVISLLSGIYPAFVLSGVRPALILKNQMTSGKTSRKAWLRSTLTVFQFVIAQAFVLGTLLVAAQIRYSLHKDMGFRKDAIVSFDVPFNYMAIPDPKPATLAQEIRQIPGTEAVSLSQFPPASGGMMTRTMIYKGRASEITTNLQIKSADTNYMHLYHLRLLAGRNVSASDTMKELVINETYMRTLGFKTPQEALGKLVYSYGGRRAFPIVGVMADFNTRSLHEAIAPAAVVAETEFCSKIAVALTPDNPEGTAWKKTLSSLEATFKTMYPGYEFHADFFDKEIEGLYSEEQEMNHLLTWATGLAILISCLGMLGLVLHTTRQRVKEIGIRKVLGASVGRIVVLLTAGFLRLVGLSFIIAAPIAWYWMHHWLENFAYKVQPGFGIFAEGGLLMILVALLTLGALTLRAARANPVESLRTE